jgi:hypothetical protein
MTMEYDGIPGPDGLEIRVPKSDDYRTCSQCGGDCEPDTTLSAGGTGVRVAWVCAAHGVNAVVDPFEDLR